MTEENTNKRSRKGFIISSTLLILVFGGSLGLAPLWFYLGDLTTIPWYMFSATLSIVGIGIFVSNIYGMNKDWYDDMKTETKDKNRKVQLVEKRKNLELKAKGFGLITTKDMSDEEIEEIIHNYKISPEYQKVLKNKATI